MSPKSLFVNRPFRDSDQDLGALCGLCETLILATV